MADAELANDLKKLTSAKVDKVHPGQLIYVHWINCVNESRSIIKQYGLMPEIKNTDDLNMLFPPMSRIYDWIESGVEKDMCLRVTDHFYSKVTTASKRSLAKQSFYKEKSSLVTHLKLMHAAALKRLKKEFPKVFAKAPFLKAGTYVGCKATPNDQRDSLCYRDGEGPENIRILDSFNGFRLTTNETFLTPLATAAHLFEPKNAASTKGKSRREKYQVIVANWKRDNNYRPYVPMPVMTEKPANNAGNGRGSEDTNSDVDDSKALTKVKFREPMRKLGKALEKCLKEHAKNKQEHILTDVLIKYNAIQKMVGYGKTLPIKQQEDIDEDDSNMDEVEEDSEYEEIQDNDESDSEDADSGSGSDNESGSISDTESDDDEENDDDASKYDAGSDASDGGGNDDAVGNRAGDDNTEVPPAGTNKAIQGKDVAVGDSANGAADGDNSHGESTDDEHNNDDNTHDVNDKDGANKEDALTVLTNHIDGELKGKVKRSKMPAADIQSVLGLTEQPNLKSKTDRAYFCSFKSDDMKLIKKLYVKNDSEEVRAEIANKEWIPSLVRLMLDLNWHSSVKDLPDESTYNEEDEILLWNPIVSEKFM